MWAQCIVNYHLHKRKPARDAHSLSPGYKERQALLLPPEGRTCAFRVGGLAEGLSFPWTAPVGAGFQVLLVFFQTPLSHFLQKGALVVEILPSPLCFLICLSFSVLLELSSFQCRGS